MRNMSSVACVYVERKITGIHFQEVIICLAVTLYTATLRSTKAFKRTNGSSNIAILSV